MSTATTKPWADGPFPLIIPPSSKPDAIRDDFTAAATQMSLVHNVIIRHLNSIYLQAPHLLPTDTGDFLVYTRSWISFLNAHHSGEEAHFFPSIARVTGRDDLMSVNISQHAVFHTGLKALETYIASCTPESFDATKLVSLIDAFAPALLQHLHEEIPTLEKLREFKGKLDILKLCEEEAQTVMGGCAKQTTLAGFIVNLDKGFEDGKYREFPPVPWVVNLLLRVWATWKWRGAWRFASCDKWGRRKDLFRVGEVAEKE